MIISIWITQIVTMISSLAGFLWAVGIVLDFQLVWSGLFCLHIQLQCWIFQQSIVKIIGIKLQGLWNHIPLMTECNKVVSSPPRVSRQRYFTELLMNRYLSFGWSQMDDCILKQLKKGLDALAPPDKHSQIGNERRRFHHGRETVLVLFVRKNNGATTSDGAFFDVTYQGYTELQEGSGFFTQPYGWTQQNSTLGIMPQLWYDIILVIINFSLT